MTNNLLTLVPDGKITSIPTDKYILGTFIESGYGRQVTGMWSEMLYNRAFREFVPLRNPTYAWIRFDKDHYNSSLPFWHSGYEIHDWEYFGNINKYRTLGMHTYKGSTSLIIDNNGDTPGGILQRGIYLQKGREYDFSVFAGVNCWMSALNLNGFGDQNFTPETYPLEISIGGQTQLLQITKVPQKYSWHFAADMTGETEVRISIPEKYSLVLAFASLMPSDNIDGWRKDVVNLLREIGPSVIRFPGGCFVSFYDWKKTVGDRDLREPQPSMYWGDIEENDVGVDEFVRLSQLVGFTPQFCFNMMTSNPFEARQLVEYLNAPEDVGMGRLRMLNGHSEPYGVRLFEMDNEPARKWSAEQYSHQCVRFVREMRLADPDIEFMFAAYAYDVDALPAMLDIVGKDIQYVIYRDGSPSLAAKVLPILRKYNEENGTNIRLVNTEWLASCSSVEPFEDPDMPLAFNWNGPFNDVRYSITTHQRSWNYALNGAHRILDYISYGGEFALANFNNLCNTFGQNLIEASKERAWLSCMGEIFALFHKVFRPCTAQKVKTGDDKVFALIAYTDKGKQLFVINHSASEYDLVLPDAEWNHVETISSHSRLDGVTESETPLYRTVPEQNGRNVHVPGMSFSVWET